MCCVGVLCCVDVGWWPEEGWCPEGWAQTQKKWEAERVGGVPKNSRFFFPLPPGPPGFTRQPEKLGIFKDVRFYPILNFGLFWAPLFSRCFYPLVNFAIFGPPLSLLQDVRVLPHPKFFWPILGRSPLPSSRCPGFTPPEILAIFGPPLSKMSLNFQIFGPVSSPHTVSIVSCVL